MQKLVPRIPRMPGGERLSLEGEAARRQTEQNRSGDEKRRPPGRQPDRSCGAFRAAGDSRARSQACCSQSVSERRAIEETYCCVGVQRIGRGRFRYRSSKRNRPVSNL